MASTIKVDNVQNQPGTNIINKCGTTITVGAACNSVAVTGNVVKSNALQASDAGNIIKQCGTTVTLGASGDTVTLASGASQTGFGREGSVDWDTASIKTATFSAVSGNGYFCNTSGGSFTVNLPAGVAGAIVAIADYTRTFASNALTVSPDGSEKIGGIAEDASLSVDGQSATFVYVDSTEGWINIQETQTSQTGITPAYITATGGTPCSGAIVCTNYKVHTFTGPGNFIVTAGGGPIGLADYLVVGGGGGGGARAAGGGGAGGYRESNGTSSGCYTTSPLGTTPTTVPALTLAPGTYPVTVGGAGAGGTPGGGETPAVQGPSSVFSTVTSAGGGGGKGGGCVPRVACGNGGSGGGGAPGGSAVMNAGGTGNTPPTTPPQGNTGGANPAGTIYNGAGGGGAGAVGQNAQPAAPAAGGVGLATCITASPVFYGGGGGGGSWPAPAGATGGAGGNGGGGNGRPGTGGANNPRNGSANTGGGGGGEGGGDGSCGGNGGSGVVVIRYKFQ